MDYILPVLNRIRDVDVPRGDIIENWDQRRDRLRNREPTDEELVNKWWRGRFLNYLRYNIEKKEQKHVIKHDWGLEDNLWNGNPHLKTGWIRRRLGLVSFIPQSNELRNQWWRRRGYDFVKKRAELSTGPYQKKFFRLDVFFTRIAFCRHKQCFALRLSFIFWLILHLIVILWAFPTKHLN